MTPRRARALFVLALVLGAAATVAVAFSDHEDHKVAAALLAVPIGIAFVGSGLYAWLRRPENRTGRLMTLVGFTWFIGALSELNWSMPYTLGSALSGISFIFLAWLVLAFPSGRLGSRLDRRIVALGFLLVTVGQLGWLMFDSKALACDGCPRNAFFVTEGGTVADAISKVFQGVAFALLIAIVIVLARRWRAATPARRRALSPVFLSGGIFVALLAVSIVFDAITSAADAAFEFVFFGAFLTVPLAFLSGLLRSRLARAGAGRLLVDVPDEPSVAEAEAGLRRALGDPTLELRVWLPDCGYVDRDGRPGELPEDTPTRVTTRMERAGEPIAALVHDAALREEEPDLLEDVVAAARIALEKDRTLRALRASEQRSRALLDAIPDNMFRLTRDGTYLDFSLKDPRHVAVPTNRIVGGNIRNVLPPEITELLLDAIARALDTGEIQTIEYRMQRPIGLRDSEARVVRSGEDEVVVIVRDITERKQAEAELERLHRELEARLEELQHKSDFVTTVVDTAPALICAIDLEGRIVGFNRACEETSGYSADEVRGRPLYGLLVPEDEQQPLKIALASLAETDEIVEHQNHWLTRDGERRLIQWFNKAIRQPGSEVQYVIGAGLDITDRRRLQSELGERVEELRRERDFLSLVANASPGLLCVVDHEGRVTDEGANRGFTQATGIDDPEACGWLLSELVFLPGDASQVAEAIAEAKSGQPSAERETTWLTQDGRRLHVAWTCTPLTGARENSFLIAGLDITHRKRQEEEIRASRARLIEAGDAARRRLERNLHDGAQQRLVSLSLALRLAQAKLGDDPDSATELLESASAELALALEELRELARGIHPAVLSDRGLGAALETLATRAPLPVQIERLPPARLPGPVEAAAFYVVSESLANVAKYAQATSAYVSVTQDNGYAVVEVADDGIGGADPAAGSGLRGLADRVEALDGRLEVASEPGAGTRIRAEIPCA
jgi:PAS domain S-box-containing protein